MKQTEKIRNKILNWEEATLLAQDAKKNGKSIIFTNGCFDLLHPGHLHVLGAAKDLGDILIVGLNSDESVKTLKGPDRPVMNESSRAILLAGLEMVDYVVIFTEETPLNLIREINPNIIVKGGDYAADEIVGSAHVEAYGGEVVTIPLLEGFSTTGIIRKSKPQ